MRLYFFNMRDSKSKRQKRSVKDVILKNNMIRGDERNNNNSASYNEDGWRGHRDKALVVP